MTAETNQGARRRVVPMQPVEAPTDVLPVIGGPARPVPPVPPALPSPPAPPPGPPPVPPGAPRPQPHPAARRPEPDAAVRRSGPDAAIAEPTAEEPSTEAPERRTAMGMPALVLGVLAAGTAWSGWAGVVLGLFAVGAGFLGARRAWRGLASDGGYSLGGLVLGLVGLVWGGVVVSQTLFGTGAFGDGLTLDQCLQQAYGAHEMHMCKSQHITEFNQRFPDAAE